MRKLTKLNVSKAISLALVIFIIGVFITAINFIVQISSQELMVSGGSIFKTIEQKITNSIIIIEKNIGIERINGESIGEHYLQKLDLGSQANSVIDYLGSTISMTLTTIFFTILLLAESLNFQNILNQTLIKSKRDSIKVFIKIEDNVMTFVKVKFLMSLFTGIGFSVACYFFDVDFPVFWGLLAFLLNFVQMIGSIIAVIILSLFAIIEIENPSLLVFFSLSITGVQVLFGSIIEPIFMGKSFSINIITILIMLMFWGFIWGIPGMVLSIPLTVFIKIMLEQFPKTRTIANLMSAK